MKLNFDLYNEIYDTMVDLRDRYDEVVAEDILNIIKYGLGMTPPPRYNDLPDYLDEPIHDLAIVYGSLYDKELVKLIKDAEEKYKYEPHYLQTHCVLEDLFKKLIRG